eukprot:scaffold123105_cov30-Tisochrysis_lutea.AAC.8
MEEINRSAKELWNKTYKGTDIDGIEIKSEHEARGHPTAPVSSELAAHAHLESMLRQVLADGHRRPLQGYTDAGARRHSYRVMMRKGDNLLDMRGRCSAGQRV